MVVLHWTQRQFDGLPEQTVVRQQVRPVTWLSLSLVPARALELMQVPALVSVQVPVRELVQESVLVQA